MRERGKGKKEGSFGKEDKEWEGEGGREWNMGTKWSYGDGGKRGKGD